MTARVVPEPVDPDERERLAALRSYRVLDTLPEPGFDDIVGIASLICEAPVALVSLVDQDRQWFKARVGIGFEETPLSQSVCFHALREPDLLVIPDLTQDARTSTNPLVTGTATSAVLRRFAAPNRQGRGARHALHRRP